MHGPPSLEAIFSGLLECCYLIPVGIKVNYAVTATEKSSQGWILPRGSSNKDISDLPSLFWQVLGKY